MDRDLSLGGFLIWYFVFILSLTLHEAAHALTALWGGDDTAYRGGQVSLNPGPHLRREPFGAVIVPVLSYLFSGSMIGWASAPYDPVWAARHPRRHAAMSAAGPAANLILALLAFGALKGLLALGVHEPPRAASIDHLVAAAPRFADSSWAGALGFALSIALNLNLLLFLFNLIPLPPLDGSAVLAALGPRAVGRAFEKLRQEPILSMLILLVAWKLFSYGRFFSLVLRALHPDRDYGD